MGNLEAHVPSPGSKINEGKTNQENEQDGFGKSLQ